MREGIHAVGGEHKAAAGEAKAQIQRVQVNQVPDPTDSECVLMKRCRLSNGDSG